MSILQISDTHFGTEQAPVVQTLAALAQQQRPDVLALSGDNYAARHARAVPGGLQLHTTPNRKPI